MIARTLDIRMWCFLPLSFLSLLTMAGCIRHLGSSAIYRSHVDSVKKAVLLMDPSMSVQEPGYVVGWHVYIARARRSQEVYLQIWRPVDLKTRRYQLIGAVTYNAIRQGYHNFTLYPEDRIPVETGDVLGIFFPQYNSIPWTEVACHGNNVQYFKYNPLRVRMDTQLDFEKAPADWKPCRQYSVNATIMNADEIEFYDQKNYFNLRQDHNMSEPLMNLPYGHYDPDEDGAGCCQPLSGLLLVLLSGLCLLFSTRHATFSTES